MTTLVLAALFLAVAALFSALGLGGGALYVPLLLAADVPFHQAAATSQAVIMAVAASALLVFHRAGFVDWKLVLLIEPATDLGALLGGYLSQYVAAGVGKGIFAAVVVTGAVFMLRPLPTVPRQPRRGFPYWTRTMGDATYSINWVVTVPLMVATGFLAGMLGVGGGMLKIPLLVLISHVPLKVAVGSSALMIGITSTLGLAGHAMAGHFDPVLALPLAITGFMGGQLGSRVSVAVDSRHLKRAFGVLLIVISTWMIVSAVRGA